MPTENMGEGSPGLPFNLIDSPFLQGAYLNSCETTTPSSPQRRSTNDYFFFFDLTFFFTTFLVALAMVDLFSVGLSCIRKNYFPESVPHCRLARAHCKQLSSSQMKNFFDPFGPEFRLPGHQFSNFRVFKKWIFRRFYLGAGGVMIGSPGMGRFLYSE
jgi:hypothetical protein